MSNVSGVGVSSTRGPDDLGQTAAPAAPAAQTPAAAPGRTGVPRPASLAPVSGAVPTLHTPAGGVRALSSVKDKIVSVAWKQVTEERSVSLASLDLGSRGVLGVRAYEKIIRPSDPIVAGDPHRSAYSAADPDRHGWLRTGGVVDARVGLSTAIPAGPATASVGFSASGALDYSVLAPYDLEVGSAGDLAKNMTVDLPFSAENARAMARGAEVSLRGRGTAGFSASVGAGTSAGVGPVTVGASASVSAGASVSGELTLNVKRLDGDRVFVRLGQAAGAAASTSVSARVGTSGVRDAIPELDLPGGAVGAFVEDKATKTVAKEIEKRLSAQASASAGASRGSQEVASFVLDLSTAEGRKAYDALVRLDMAPATKLAAEGKAQRVTYDETSTSRTTGVNIQAGGAKIFLADTLRREREGTLAGGAGGTIDMKTSLFKKSSEGLFSGQRDILWEGTTLKRDGGKAETYYHLNFQKNDGATREAEVGEFRRFAEGIGAAPQGATEFDATGGFFSGIFGGAYGDTKTSLDLYYTSAGLQKIAATSDDAVIAAFAANAQKLEGTERPPAWSVPESAAQAREYMRRYAAMNPGGGPRGASGDAERQRLASTYQRAFGRSIQDDIEDLRSAELLAKHVGNMRGKPESEWAAVFADLGGAARFDFWKHTATLNALAGADNTLVHELSMKGERVNFAVADEGRIAHPDEEIGKALAPA